MKSLCLDIGNVLSLIKFDEFVSTISVAVNISEAEAKERINLYQKLHDVGLISMKEILIKEFKIKSETMRKEIMSNWLDVLRLDSYMVSFFTKLVKENQINLALLSNIGYEHSTWIDNQIKITNDYFKNSIKYYSCQVGARKPSKLYYYSFLQMNPEFKGAIYVDDNQDNLNASEEFGFVPVKLDLSTMTKQEVEDKLTFLKNC